MKTQLFFFIFLTSCAPVFSQQSFHSSADSSTYSIKNTRPFSFWKQSILPITLIGVGSALNKSALEIAFQNNVQARRSNKEDFPIDDYIQYVPLAEIYLGDVIGLKAKNHWFDQTKYLLLSNALSAGLTHGLKHLTQKTRPNGSSLSFPSGHTSFSFTNATALQYEFQASSPMYAYSGYLFALTTGAYRMINNAHYLSDVLVGAGIGMISTNIVYYFEPFKKFNPFKKSIDLSVIPSFDKNVIGFHAVYQW